MKSKVLFTGGTIGILLMMSGQLSFSINDSFVKLAVRGINSDTSIFSVVFIRGIITTCLIGLYLTFYEKKNLYKILTYKRFHIRGLYEVCTASFFFVALVFLPIAEVYTLLMTNPFFVTIFAFLFLKEKVGIRRWSAVFVGFMGVIVVINPQNMNFNYLFILPIIAAIFLTIRDIATKGIVTKKNNFEIIFITSILITFFSGMGSIYTGFDISLNQLPNIFISSIFLTVAYLFSVMTIFYAPLSLTASSRYSVIIFGIIFGYLLLNEIPGINMIIGATIITASGLFVIKREKDLGKIK